MDSFRGRAIGIFTSRRAIVVWLACILLLGLLIAQDYGISWDEKAMIVLGAKVYDFIRGAGAYPADPGIRFHGAWFEVLQYAVQRLLGLTYARAIFILRHMLNFTVFWIGLVALYLIALRTFKSRGWALITMLMLFLSPRQFGHAFINGRDIPTMAFFSVKMLVLLAFIDRPTVWRAVLLGVASGVVITLRVGLLFLPLYAVLFLGILIFSELDAGKRVQWMRYGLLILVYVCSFAAAVVAWWPLLWEDTSQNLRAAFHNMLWDQQAPGGFYFGEQIGSLPWHWVPVHLVSKTPLLYVALAGIAILTLVVTSVRNPRKILTEDRSILLFLLWFILPVFAVITLHASMFDEWRHLYFVYPAFLLLAASALRSIFLVAKKNARGAWQGPSRFPRPRVSF